MIKSERIGKTLALIRNILMKNKDTFPSFSYSVLMLLWFSFVFFLSFSPLIQFQKMLSYHQPFIHSSTHPFTDTHTFFTVEFSNIVLFVWFHAQLFVYNRAPCFLHWFGVMRQTTEIEYIRVRGRNKRYEIEWNGLE